MARGRLDNSLSSDPEREASPLGLPQLLLADHGGDWAGGGQLEIRRQDKSFCLKFPLRSSSTSLGHWDLALRRFVWMSSGTPSQDRWECAKAENICSNKDSSSYYPGSQAQSYEAAWPWRGAGAGAYSQHGWGRCPTTHHAFLAIDFELTIFQKIHGGLLTPNEGHIDPYSLTQVKRLVW